MSATLFDKVMSGKSDAGLKSIIADKDGYRIEAREAAIRQLESRSVEVADDLKDLSEVKSKLVEEAKQDEERKRRKERFFYIPKEAPTAVVVSGIGLYILTVISFVVSIFSDTVNTLSGGAVFKYVLIFVVHSFFVGLIDFILKGRNGARLTYAIFFGLGFFFSLGSMVTVVLGKIFIDFLGIIMTLAELAMVILLFVRPANLWFSQNKPKHKSQETDLLDDY